MRIKVLFFTVLLILTAAFTSCDGEKGLAGTWMLVSVDEWDDSLGLYVTDDRASDEGAMFAAFNGTAMQAYLSFYVDYDSISAGVYYCSDNTFLYTVSDNIITATVEGSPREMGFAVNGNNLTLIVDNEDFPLYPDKQYLVRTNLKDIADAVDDCSVFE